MAKAATYNTGLVRFISSQVLSRSRSNWTIRKNKRELAIAMATTLRTLRKRRRREEKVSAVWPPPSWEVSSSRLRESFMCSASLMSQRTLCGDTRPSGIPVGGGGGLLEQEKTAVLVQALHTYRNLLLEAASQL